MRFNSSHFFVRVVYYLYLSGLIALLLDIIGTLTMKGNIFMLFTIFRFFLPIAGLAGIIPYPLLFFCIPILLHNVGHHSIIYYAIRLSIFPIIFLQKIVVDKIKLAIAKNEKGNTVFRIIILHNILVTMILVSAPNLGLFNKEWGLGWMSELYYGYPLPWIFCGIVNLLIALGVWRWTKK